MARVHKHFTTLPAEAQGCVVAIGNFDGVHRGHQKLLSIAHDIAQSQGVPFGVLTFDPHPRWFFNPTQVPFLLSSEDLKMERLENEGVDHIFVAKFDATFAALPAERFVEDLLVQTLAVSHVVVGEDYHFGQKRQGDVEALRQFGAKFKFGVTSVAQYKDQAELVYSSTRVRAALNEGNLKLASKILGRSWDFQGRVVRLEGGDASIALGENQRPFPGLYAVRVETLDQTSGQTFETHETLSWVSVRKDCDDGADPESLAVQRYLII